MNWNIALLPLIPSIVATYMSNRKQRFILGAPNYLRGSRRTNALAERSSAMKASRIYRLIVLPVISLVLALTCCKGQPKPGTVQDEALRAGRLAASFPAADENYFHDMDGGVALTPDEVKG